MADYSGDKPYLGIQFPREVYYDLKEMAQQRQVSMKKMTRVWICERLAQEQMKEAAHAE